MVLNGHVALDGLMFDNVLFYPFIVTVLFVRAKESFCPQKSYDVVSNVLVKGGVFEFI